MIALIAILILVGHALPAYAQAACGGVWPGSMPSSVSSQSSLAEAAAHALNNARIPGMSRAREAYNTVLVEVASEAWRSDHCGLLASIARGALSGSRGVLLPIDVRIQGASARSAVTIVDRGSAMRWQVLHPKTTPGFLFSVGDSLVNVNNGMEIGVVVRTEMAHTFRNGTVGRAYIIARPNGAEMDMVAEVLERIAAKR